MYDLVHECIMHFFKRLPIIICKKKNRDVSDRVAREELNLSVSINF